MVKSRASTRARARLCVRFSVMVNARARVRFRVRVMVNARARVRVRVRAGGKLGLVLMLGLG